MQSKTRTRHASPASAAVKVAAKLRTKYPSGAIVIFKGRFAGWMNELRSPDHWEPGCVAVLPDGSAHLAEGGNAYDGAARWTATPAT